MNKYPERLTTNDVQELKTWFSKAELPKTMQINKSTYSPDLPLTVTHLLTELEANYENPYMHGSYRLLCEIKENLE